MTLQCFRIGTYLEMNMNSSARIPARINGDKTHAAVLVRYLIAAQEFLSHRIEIPVLDIRIDSLRIAMPDIDYGIGKRQAPVRTLAAHRENAHLECKRKAVFYRAIGRIGSNVRTIQAFIDEIRPLRLLRCYHA